MIHGFGVQILDPGLFFVVVLWEIYIFSNLTWNLSDALVFAFYVIILQLCCLFLRKSDVLLSPSRGQMTEVLFSCQNTHQLAATCQALIILLILLVSIASTGGGVLFSIEKAEFGPILAILSQIYALFGIFWPWCCTKIDEYEIWVMHYKMYIHCIIKCISTVLSSVQKRVQA